MSSEAKERDENAAGAKDLPVGPWDPALDKLREWDPKWAETLLPDEHQSMDSFRSAPQVYRVGQRQLECRLHQSKFGGNAPPHPGRA